MPSSPGSPHQASDHVLQDRPLASLPEHGTSTISHPRPRAFSANISGPSPSLSQSSSSGLPSLGRPSPDKGRRKPVPRITSQDLDGDDSHSQRHLSEDISRYPSTITGHIGQATRDDRFADATGPYHLVPVDEFGRMVDVPRHQLEGRMISPDSRDPTFSSFEAFVLAPSTSSFTIYDKQQTLDCGVGSLEVDMGAEGKDNRTPRSSPLKNQVKVSMESRRTVTSSKGSSDTVRSNQATIDLSQSSTKSSKRPWNLFSRLDNTISSRTDHTPPPTQSADASPSKPSSRSAITPKTQRQMRKLSIQPISPFQVPPLPTDPSSRRTQPKGSHRTRNDPGDFSHVGGRDTSGSAPASEKTIRSFAALRRPSVDTPAAMRDGRAWTSPRVTVDETPTRSGKYTLGRGVGGRITGVALPQIHARIELVDNTERSASSASTTAGIPRVDTRYLDDDDLLTRHEAYEREHRVPRELTGRDGDVTSGYWDYSIVTGIGGSPSRDYSVLLRNASLMKQFSDIAGSEQKVSAGGDDPKGLDAGLADPSSAQNANHVVYGNLTAPRSSSDKSLTSSSNYPDDTDGLSENSHSKYSGKRKARHARRRNRPVSMASLAAPLGEDPLDGSALAGGGETKVRVMGDDATDIADEVQIPLGPNDMEDRSRAITPGESSFAQSLPEVTTDTEAGTLFTHFPLQPMPATTTQIERFTPLPTAFHFPSPPPSQKHSSLLSDILAVTRESYQARKEKQGQTGGALAEEKPESPAGSTLTGTTLHSGRIYRGSIGGARNGDQSLLQVIHENEATPSNLPLTSESLRELDRRFGEESTQRGESMTVHVGSTCDLERAGGALVGGGLTIPRQNTGQRQSPDSLDNLSLATTTTVRPSFHGSHRRQNNDPPSNRLQRAVVQQPIRSAMPLRPLGRDNNLTRQDDELPEGIFDNPLESSALCVCFGLRVW